MIRLAHPLLLALFLVGCRQPATAGEAGAVNKDAAPAAASERWTPERVRGFLLEIQAMIDADIARAAKQYDGSKEVGECYGETAVLRHVKVSEVMPRLEARLSGRALDCYVASYYGCRVGDWFGSAAVSNNGPGYIVYKKSPVKIIEQSADRVVADVTEADYETVAQGSIDRRNLSRSRYTLTRDARRVWRVADRVPAFKEWECRPK